MTLMGETTRNPLIRLVMEIVKHDRLLAQLEDFKREIYLYV